MCELCHVVGLVELGRVDFVDGVRFDLLLGAIVALYEDASLGQVFHDPAPDECSGRIPKPDIALAGEVIFALDDAPESRCLLAIVRYELGCKGADWCAVSRRVGSYARRVASA
jgi:hypothetical protein